MTYLREELEARRENADVRLKGLKEEAATGLDMSPGNPNSAWALQEIEALRERATELEGLVKDRHRIAQNCMNWQSRAEAAEAHAVELAVALGKMISGVQAMAEGDVPPLELWQELWDEARTALAATPTEALERARAKDEVVDLAAAAVEEEALNFFRNRNDDPVSTGK